MQIVETRVLVKSAVENIITFSRYFINIDYGSTTVLGLRLTLTQLDQTPE
jgi:hypothetical protein